MERQELWAVVARLEQAIRDTVENSEEINALVAQLQQAGVEIQLNCVAQITVRGDDVGDPPPGFLEADDDDDGFDPIDFNGTDDSEDTEEELTFGVDDDDRRFLRNLGIRFD